MSSPVRPECQEVLKTVLEEHAHQLRVLLRELVLKERTISNLEAERWAEGHLQVFGDGESFGKQRNGASRRAGATGALAPSDPGRHKVRPVPAFNGSWLKQEKKEKWVKYYAKGFVRLN